VRSRSYAGFFFRSWSLAIAASVVAVALSAHWSPAVGQESPADTPDAGLRHAVVLGGGGSVGEAWELGVIKGLRDAGVDVTDAELFVGTSGGSHLATLIRAGLDIDDLYASTLVAGPATGLPVQSPEDTEVTAALSRMWQGPAAPERTVAQRVEIGGRALSANAVPEDERVEDTARDLAAYGIADWPNRPLKLAAVDVFDGTIRFFDRTQGVPISRAVMASRAQPGRDAPVTAGGRRYMDGGVIGENLEGAIGYNVVVAITPGGAGERARNAVERYLTSHGGTVVHVIPPPGSPAVTGFGDPAAALDAGAEYGAEIADQVRIAWTRGAAWASEREARMFPEPESGDA
jgi:NTE family protein